MLSHVDMRSDPLASAVDPERTQHEPQLQPPEPATERSSVDHEVAHRLTLSRRQVSRSEAERPLEELLARAVEDAAVDWGEQPLMRIDEEGVRALAAGHDPPVAVQHSGRAPIRGVDVEPQVLPFADVRDVGDGVDGGYRCRADGGNDSQRNVA